MRYFKNLRQLGNMATGKGKNQDPSTYKTFTSNSGKTYKMDNVTHSFHTMFKDMGRGFQMPGWSRRKSREEALTPKNQLKIKNI